MKSQLGSDPFFGLQHFKRMLRSGNVIRRAETAVGQSSKVADKIKNLDEPRSKTVKRV